MKQNSVTFHTLFLTVTYSVYPGSPGDNETPPTQDVIEIEDIRTSQGTCMLNFFDSLNLISEIECLLAN